MTAAAQQLRLDLLEGNTIKPSFIFEDGIQHYVKAGSYGMDG